MIVLHDMNCWATKHGTSASSHLQAIRFIKYYQLSDQKIINWMVRKYKLNIVHLMTLNGLVALPNCTSTIWAGGNSCTGVIIFNLKDECKRNFTHHTTKQFGFMGFSFSSHPIFYCFGIPKNMMMAKSACIGNLTSFFPAVLCVCQRLRIITAHNEIHLRLTGWIPVSFYHHGPSLFFIFNR